MELQAAITVVCALITGALGFAAGFTTKRHQEESVSVPDHQHDFHISGKKNGQVALRCVVTGCTVTDLRPRVEV